MMFEKRGDTRSWKKHEIAISVELALEEAMDLSLGRLRSELLINELIVYNSYNMYSGNTTFSSYYLHYFKARSYSYYIALNRLPDDYNFGWNF
jgi:hypothetical protein